MPDFCDKIALGHASAGELYGASLIFDALPFGRLWYGEPNAITNAFGHAEHRSRSYDAVIRVYDDAGNVIETHKHTGGEHTIVVPALYAARDTISVH